LVSSWRFGNTSAAINAIKASPAAAKPIVLYVWVMELEREQHSTVPDGI